jgi:hypothetical protein
LGYLMQFVTNVSFSNCGDFNIQAYEVKKPTAQ